MYNNHVFRGLWNSLLFVLYPEICAGCGTGLSGSEHVLCLHCVTRLPRTGYHPIKENLSMQILSGRIPIERATSFVYFTKQGIMQHLLHGLKYKNRQQTGTILGTLLAEELKNCGWLDTIDGIIPVPLHRRKALRRGYNQACRFAEGIANASGIPVWDKHIKRIRDTDSQTNKSRAERIENVAGVFEAVKPELLKHKHVLLTDDVLTTGATLESCARALLAIEGIKISIATIAVANE